MSVAVRKLGEIEAYDDARALGTLKPGLTEIPPWFLKEFIERPGHNPSFYTVPDTRDAVLGVASALCMSAQLPKKSQVILLAVPLRDIADAGLSMTRNRGTTGHSDVDPLHMEVLVPHQEALFALSRLYMNAKSYVFEAKVVLNAIRSDVSAGRFDFLGQAKISPDKAICRNALQFVHEQIANIVPYFARAEA